MIWQAVNFTKDNYLMAQVENGDTLLYCNLWQFSETEVFVGIQNLQIIRSNIINCIFPPSTKISTSNEAKIEYEKYIDNEDGREKIRKIRDNGKFNNIKMTGLERKQVMASDTITNATVKRIFYKEIEKAKKDLKKERNG